MPASPSLVWFRLDLRLADHPALTAAVRRGGPVIPVFIWAPAEDGDWPPGGASRWWLHQSLSALAAALERRGSRLVLRQGASLVTLRALVRETGAGAVFWNRRYEPALIARDKQVKEALRADGLEVESFNSALLFEPWTVANRAGRPFQVFTPFWRHCLDQPDPPAPDPAPESLPAPVQWPKSEPLAALALEPRPDWAGGLRAAWQPGEAGAAANLQGFLERTFAEYAVLRDRPDQPGTSRLSPHLHFGEIGPRQVWQAVKALAARRGLPSAAWRGGRFLAELGWREFAHHLLFHFPHTPAAPLREEFARFVWRRNPAGLKAWQRGRTGYPIVDAGMRELWRTGWMHNRVRMIAASFLVKDLLVDWREGARWFWDTLVDADLAANTLGWQWTAGCGADAAPFFRIFNPVTQGQKFDPQGEYVRRWVPELAHLPAEWIHQPWAAPPEVLTRAGVVLGKHYPEPVVNHAIAREVALEALAKIRVAH
jgi:deoxyribodipyrimidine photo-lyase